MAIIQLKWDVTNLTTLLAAGYDRQKIEVENPATVWTEFTRPHMRLPLVENVEQYLYELPSDIAYGFRAVPYRTSDGSSDTPIDITTKVIRGYCTIADMRAEGYGAVAYPDARVQEAIDTAVMRIDNICGQRFDPYYAVVTLNVKKTYGQHSLDVPIAALWRIDDGDTTLTLADILVYNRHLTQGLANPDDRKYPHLAYGTAREREQVRVFDTGNFIQGRKTLKLFGVWGYTDLGAADVVGETAEGSQIPLSYGSTPRDIRRACMLLVADGLPTIASGGSAAAKEARIIEEKTRDQWYKLQPLSEAELSSNISGNPEVDDILMRYVAPLRIGSV